MKWRTLSQRPSIVYSNGKCSYMYMLFLIIRYTRSQSEPPCPSQKHAPPSQTASLKIGTCLRWHVCRVNFARKIFFLSHEFSYEKCPEISPESFEPLFCGSEKIPQNSRQNSHQISQISLRKIKKNSPTSFCRSAGRTLATAGSLPLTDNPFLGG